MNKQKYECFDGLGYYLIQTLLPVFTHCDVKHSISFRIQKRFERFEAYDVNDHRGISLSSKIKEVLKLFAKIDTT